MNQRELALGTRSRSGDQFDIWEAVFSPSDMDGYPKRIFDKYTGAIDSSVAEYWREHYDLTHIIQRDWPKIGDKLKGKIHIYVGTMDTYYLNDAVYDAEDVLEEKLGNPACGCQVVIMEIGRSIAGMGIRSTRTISAACGITRCISENGRRK